MITNERQYRIAKAEAEKFESALAQGPDPNSALDPEMQELMAVGLVSQLAELRAQLATYEAWRNGQGSPITVRILDELPDALIQARIAANLTQKQLAQRLDLKEQQIQRYEQSRYASASWTRLLEVATVLGVRLVEPAHLEVTPLCPFPMVDEPAPTAASRT